MTADRTVRTAAISPACQPRGRYTVSIKGRLAELLKMKRPIAATHRPRTTTHMTRTTNDANISANRERRSKPIARRTPYSLSLDEIKNEKEATPRVTRQSDSTRAKGRYSERRFSQRES